VFVIAFLVVVVAVASITSLELFPNPISPCNQAFVGPLVKGFNSSASGISAYSVVFVTNSTSMVCVRYSNGLESGINPSARLLVNGTYTASNDVTVTMSTVAPSYVAYTITVSSGSKGIFNVQLPSACFGPEIFLAVGYSLHQLNDATLKVPTEVYSCPAVNSIGSVMGTTNLEVAWVRLIFLPFPP